MNLNFLSQGYFRHFYFVVEQGDPAVPVDHAFLSQTEDVFERGIRLWYDKRSEQAVTFAGGILEAHGRHLPGGGMYLMIVVAGDLFPQHSPAIFDVGYVFKGAGSHYPVL